MKILLGDEEENFPEGKIAVVPTEPRFSFLSGDYNSFRELQGKISKTKMPVRVVLENIYAKGEEQDSRVVDEILTDLFIYKNGPTMSELYYQTKKSRKLTQVATIFYK